MFGKSENTSMKQTDETMRGHSSDASTTDIEMSERATKSTGDAGQTVNDDNPEYPTGVKLFLIILALCLAVFLMALEYVCHYEPGPCAKFLAAIQ
jgi:hypothetical protein